MSLIGKFAHLPGRPKSSEAVPLLEKIASQVKPIMKKRGWKVGVLGEFFPDNPALLGINMNRGQRINLRLRPHNNPTSFYDYEQLVLVMLHELTHIVHGPHDAQFYKLLSELEEEFHDLKRKGYSGEGFHSDGNRLHGNRLNEYEGRKRGLAAAEKRFQQQRVMGRGGVLGGSSTAGKSMREIVAEAAERRLKDDKTCKNDSTEAEVEDRKAQEESVVVDATGLDSDESGAEGSSRKRPLSEASAPATSGSATEPIVIDDDDAPASPPPRPKKTWATDNAASASSSRTVSAASSNRGTPAAPAAPVPSSVSAKAAGSKPGVSSGPSTRPPPAAPPKPKPKPKPAAKPSPTEWSCGTCTLINPISARSCNACAAPRPAQQSTADGWFCEFCGAGPREMGYWSCLECGWVRKWG